MAGDGRLDHPLRWPPRILLGAINGLVVWKTGVNAFIVTLGAMLGYRGLVFHLHRRAVLLLDELRPSRLRRQHLGPIPATGDHLPALHPGDAPGADPHRHGRNTYAIGDNREASVERRHPRRAAHDDQLHDRRLLRGAWPGCSGRARWLGEPQPRALYELWVITAVVLGGTKLTGGYGSIVGTLGGVLAIGILRNGVMNLMQVPAFYVNLVIGIILIAVLFLDKQLNRRGAEELKT
jgi:ribose transport system permease protein